MRLYEISQIVYSDYIRKYLIVFANKVRTSIVGNKNRGSNKPLFSWLRLLNTIRTSIQEDKESKFYYFGLKRFMEQGA